VAQRRAALSPGGCLSVTSTWAAALGCCLAGAPPAATAVLLTPRDGRADWLRAGQALHRLLTHAASKWLFASLYTQPLEAAATRALIRDRLALPGGPADAAAAGPGPHHARHRPPAARWTDRAMRWRGPS
jgi:hypothetical protein